MSRLSHLRLERAFASIPLVLMGAAFLVTLSGCPGGSELEDPGKYGIAGGPVTGSGGTTGGSTGTGGATGGTTGGTTGGSAGTAGTMLTVNCTGTTYQSALASCNGAGCHSAIYPQAGLNLVADANLVSRLKDVPSTHASISCTGPSDTTCTCSSEFLCTTPPSTCPPAAQGLLVDSQNPANSWMLKKIDLSDPMCGVQMPETPYKSPADKACLEAMVQAIAMLPK